MREVVLLLIVVTSLFLAPIHLKAATQFDVTGPVGSERFGQVVAHLSNGNFVVADPLYDNGPIPNVGAVYLFNGATGALISTLTGTTANDKVGGGNDPLGSPFASGIRVLPSGNFVVMSPEWDNGGAVDAGAATWVNGMTGLGGSVSAENSIVGSTAIDSVGAEVIVLSNGNYIVNNSRWDNGAIIDAGAVVWGSGTAGVSGPISAQNALVGAAPEDRLGYFGVTVLTNGNYVVTCPVWDNGAVMDAGAATFGNGTTGITGFVSPANSLVGSHPGDGVGSTITPLANGNYVATAGRWDNELATDAGAVTFGDGQRGTAGVVSAANSLVGSTTNDFVGRITALKNGNYVVRSPNWDNGAAQDAGAATFANGTTGISGTISASNSLVGTTPSELVGDAIAELANGNYVLSTINWDNAGVMDVGAVTWANGTIGITGTISPSNSLIGSHPVDNVGGVLPLTNGNYVVSSGSWDNGPVINAGAVTWADGTTGLTGVVSTGNSLVGSSPGDQVGTPHPLANGNYFVTSPFWDNGATRDAGAVTWASGTGPSRGVVSPSNSLVGSTTNDRVGPSMELTNGNYVVSTQFWDNGSIVDAGSAVWGNGSTGITGVISSTNALIGSTPSDQICCGLPLANGNYVIAGYRGDNGPIVDAGAVIWGSGTSGVTGYPSASNALVGTSPGDMVGNDSIGLLSNGDYVVNSPNWDNGPIVDAGAITYGNGCVGTRGYITSENSVRGTAAGGGALMRSSYDSVNRQLIVGRPAENIVTLFRPTAETFSVSGRVVTPNGSALPNATMRLTRSDGSSRTVLTSSFGFYTFENVTPCETYYISVNSRRFRFSRQIITVNGDLTDVNFIGAE